METLKAIEHPIAKQTAVLVDICAYAGTGNVLKLQSMLHHCNDHFNVPEPPRKEGEESTATPASQANGAAPAEDDSNGDVDMSESANAQSAAQPNGTSSDNAHKATKKDEPDLHQSFAVIGIALIAMGEDVGAEMTLRSFNHLVRKHSMFFVALLVHQSPPLTAPLNRCIMANQL